MAKRHRPPTPGKKGGAAGNASPANSPTGKKDPVAKDAGKKDGKKWRWQSMYIPKPISTHLLMGWRVVPW